AAARMPRGGPELPDRPQRAAQDRDELAPPHESPFVQVTTLPHRTPRCALQQNWPPMADMGSDSVLLNPPDIKNFNCADAATGRISSVANMPTIVLVAFAVRDMREKVFMVSSSPFEFALCAMLAASCHLQTHVQQSEFVRSPRGRARVP